VEHFVLKGVDELLWVVWQDDLIKAYRSPRDGSVWLPAVAARNPFPRL
jgi:hypothetical protein